MFTENYPWLKFVSSWQIIEFSGANWSRVCMNSIFCSAMHHQQLSTRKTITMETILMTAPYKLLSMTISRFLNCCDWRCQWNALLLTVVSRNEAARCKQQIKINLKRFPDQFLVRLLLLNDDKRRFRFLSSFWFCTQNRKWTKLDSRTNADRLHEWNTFGPNVIDGVNRTTFLLRYKGFTRFTIRKH